MTHPTRPAMCTARALTNRNQRVSLELADKLVRKGLFVSLRTITERNMCSFACFAISGGIVAPVARESKNEALPGLQANSNSRGPTTTPPQQMAGSNAWLTMSIACMNNIQALDFPKREGARQR